MRIFICVLISRKNIKFLNSFLNSLNQIILPINYNLKLVFVIESDLVIATNLIKKIIKKIDYTILLSGKKSIPYSRNIFLNFLQKQTYEFAGFLDDDCIVNNKWLFNMIKFFNNYNCDIAGGPQKHQVKNTKFKDFFNIIEPKRHHGELVKWVASNNCFFSNKITKNSEITFDNNLKNYGGSDQLFFSQLSKKNFKIRWNILSFITEKYQIERENKLWFFKRNLRFGYSGNLIDKKNYGNLSKILVPIKIVHLLSNAFVLLIIPTRKNLIKSSFLFFRAAGRLIGLLNYKPKKYI